MEKFELTFKKTTKPKFVLIYYEDNTGKIVAISSHKNKEFEQYSIKELEWEEGKDFISGVKSPDHYFVNIDSIRKEIVKKNLVQIAGHGHNFDYFDVLDYTITDKNKADILIKHRNNILTIITKVEFYPLYMTLEKQPMLLLETIKYDGRRKYQYNINYPISLYADFKYYRTLKVYFEK